MLKLHRYNFRNPLVLLIIHLKLFAQLISWCVSWRIVGRRQFPLNSPTWFQKGADPAACCLPSLTWLTVCWPVGGTLIWLMLTWRFSWRSANPNVDPVELEPLFYCENLLGFILILDLVLFPAPSPLSVTGLCCHGSFAPPLLPARDRVGGATGLLWPITLFALVR